MSRPIMDRNRNHSFYRSVDKSLEAEENCRCRLKFGDRAMLASILRISAVLCLGLVLLPRVVHLTHFPKFVV